MLTEEQEQATEGRIGEEMLFTLFGITLQRSDFDSKAVSDTWVYVILLNRGAVLSILHIDGHASCDGKSWPKLPEQDVSTPSLLPPPLLARARAAAQAQC